MTTKLGAGLTEKVAKVRLLALVPAAMQDRIRRQLAPLAVTIDFFAAQTDLSRRLNHAIRYEVALLPAALPAAGWWFLWSEVALLDTRPEVVVYAQSPTFALWSAVLELGGHDVIVEPFTAKELRTAVLRAARSFAECHRDDSESLPHPEEQ